jgi:hypothetical protein
LPENNETGELCWLISLMAALAAPCAPELDAAFLSDWDRSSLAQALRAIRAQAGAPAATADTVSALHVVRSSPAWSSGQHDPSEFFMLAELAGYPGFATRRDVTRTYKPATAPSAAARTEHESFWDFRRAESLAHYSPEGGGTTSDVVRLSAVFPRVEVTETDACTVRTETRLVCTAACLPAAGAGAHPRANDVLVFTTGPPGSSNVTVQFEPQIGVQVSTPNTTTTTMTSETWSYDLRSVIVWRGRLGPQAAGGLHDLSEGHYAAYARLPDDSWWFCNEGQMTRCPAGDSPETWPYSSTRLPRYSYAPVGFKPQYRDYGATATSAEQQQQQQQQQPVVVTLASRAELAAHKAAHAEDTVPGPSPWAPSRHGTFFVYCKSRRQPLQAVA